METPGNTNKWFWVLILVIVLVTVAAIIYCKRKQALSSEASAPEGPLNAIDELQSLQNLFTNQ